MTKDKFTEKKVGKSKDIPAKIVIYGEPKVGKTSFAAMSSDPFLIDIEGGANYLQKEIRATPTLESYDDVIAWLRHIYEDEDFTCGTIILDSLDWLESRAQARLVKLHNARNINDSKVKEFAYFKGVVNAAEDAMIVLQWLDAIWKKKSIRAILIAHSQVKNVDLPNQDPYSRHEMKLSKALAARVNEWADLILYAGYSFHVTDDGKKTSEPKRILYAGGSASFVGGGRMTLNKELPLNYDKLVEELTK